ncbi:hypothetical protein JTB14_001711 [Gonioctena quinquepunctata]|nr:hypothetical protein JTB14_001711 [Gonioctena quinquepunctata]
MLNCTDLECILHHHHYYAHLHHLQHGNHEEEGFNAGILLSSADNFGKSLIPFRLLNYTNTQELELVLSFDNILLEEVLNLSLGVSPSSLCPKINGMSLNSVTYAASYKKVIGINQ